MVGGKYVSASFFFTSILCVLLVDVTWAIFCLIVSSMIAWDGGWLRGFLKNGLPQHRGDGFSLITITPMGVGKPCTIIGQGKCDRLSYNQFSILEHVWRCWVVLNQGSCGFSQYNLTDNMLGLDANTTMNQSYVLFITLVNMTVSPVYPFLG